MSELYVLDSSAILSFLYREPGGEKVYDLMPQAIVSAVNYAEILTKMYDRGFSDDDFAAALADLKPTIVEFDQDQAIAAAGLRNATRSKGLSLGDRACLALAASRGGTAVTTDRAWKVFDGIAQVMLLR